MEIFFFTILSNQWKKLCHSNPTLLIIANWLFPCFYWYFDNLCLVLSSTLQRLGGRLNIYLIFRCYMLVKWKYYCKLKYTYKKDLHIHKTQLRRYGETTIALSTSGCWSNHCGMGWYLHCYSYNCMEKLNQIILLW